MKLKYLLTYSEYHWKAYFRGHTDLSSASLYHYFFGTYSQLTQMVEDKEGPSHHILSSAWINVF